MKASIVFLILFLTQIAFAQSMKRISVKGMEIKWSLMKDTVQFEVFAPTQGWVAVGFNSSNNIVGANLIMGASKNNKSIFEDQYVISTGVHKEFKLVGGKTAISNLICTENASGTTMKFNIPQKQLDKFHHPLASGKKIWLICAYSQQDDFDHHSIMRKHIEVTL